MTEHVERVLIVVAVGVVGALLLVLWLVPGEYTPERTVADGSTRVDSRSAFSTAGGVPDATAGEGAGALAVYSFPNGATVYLDANAVGTTPLELDAIAAGTYTLTLQADGYNPIDTVASVTPGERTSLVVFHEFAAETATLEPAELLDPMQEPPPIPRVTRPPPPRQTERPVSRPPPVATPQPEPTSPPPALATGTLAVVVRPWGTIIVDGTTLARETDVQHATTLPIGEHRVRATHPMLGSREVTVTVRPGTTARVEIDLN